MFTLNPSTELMKSHKAAQVLSDQSAFDVLQSSGGLSLFFGIGDTSILYLNAEQTAVATGWTPIDLTTELGANFPGQTISAKSFAVAQDPTTANITIAQIVHVAETNSDALFVMSGLSNAPNAPWMQSSANRTWVARAYDDSTNPQTVLNLAYVTIPDGPDSAEAGYVLAGLVSASTGFIQDYIVNLTATSNVWTVFPNPENFDTLNDIATGAPAGAQYGGLYQLYSLSGGVSLTFTPWRGIFPGPPPATKLTVPAGASALSTTPTGAGGSTDLYVAATGGIYLFPAAGQASGASGIQIISDDSIVDVVSLGANLAGNQLSIWGRTDAGVVFYSRCALGSQSDPTAWSAPIPLLTGVDQLATMLDLSTGASVLYSHTSGQQVVKLQQDPVTTQWRQSSILLPALSIDDVCEFYTYTTRVAVVDENQLPLVGQQFTITSTSPCGGYIEDVYMQLSPTIALPVTADMQGSVTIVQETQTLGAICFNLAQGDGSLVNVNPMLATINRMSGIQNGAQLAAVQVTDENGNTTPLVPAGTASGNTDAVAQGIAQFVKTAARLPQNGTSSSGAQSLLSRTAAAPKPFDATQGSVWGIKFDNGNLSYFEGSQQMAAAGLATALPAGKLGGIGGAIEAFAGDIFKWLEHAIDKVKKFFVQAIGDVTHFFIQIGEKLYHFVMEAIDDVAHGIQFILNAIKVAWDKIVQWVGFIFSWNDIVRTHKVLKNIFKCYIAEAIASIATVKADIQAGFTEVQNVVDTWAGLVPDNNVSAASLSKNNAPPQGSSTPQANYGAQHVKSSGSSAATSYSPAAPGSSVADQLMAALTEAFRSEEDNFKSAYKAIKTQVIDEIHTMTPLEAVKKVVAILFDLLLETVETLTVAIIDILAALAEGVADFLDAPLDIPVLSWLYSKISGGDQLSLLDLACLIAAIPVTIVVKIVSQETPFPDDSFTTSLIDAQSFSDIQALYQNQQTPTLAARAEGLGAQAASPQAVSNRLAAILDLTGGLAATIGSIGVVVFGALKAETQDSVVFAALYAVSYLPYVAPDITGQVVGGTKATWDVKMNTAVMAVGTIKTFVDVGLCKYQEGVTKGFLQGWKKFSPWGEMIINIVWEAPVIGSLVQNHDEDQDWAGFVGNTGFNAGGWITPGTVYGPEPSKAGFTATVVGLTGLYGILMPIQGGMLYASLIKEAGGTASSADPTRFSSSE